MKKVLRIEHIYPESIFRKFIFPTIEKVVDLKEEVCQGSGDGNYFFYFPSEEQKTMEELNKFITPTKKWDSDKAMSFKIDYDIGLGDVFNIIKAFSKKYKVVSIEKHPKYKVIDILCYIDNFMENWQNV